MPGLEMRTNQENDFRVRMIGAGTIQTHPQLVAFACPRRADIGVRVMTVDAPRRENSFRETIFPRPPDVIHDLVAAIFYDGFAYARSDRVEHFVPTDTFPFTFAAFASALQRIKNAIRIGNLIECSRTLRAIASAAARVLRIAFE